MKSPMLLSFILSFSVACSSTPDENSSDKLGPEGEIPASVATQPETDVKAVAAAPEAEKVATLAPLPVPVETDVSSMEKLVYPTSSRLNLRQGPGKSHGIVRVVKFGDAIAITGEADNSWLKTTDGLWVSSLFTTESKPAQPNDPVLESAPVGTAVEATPVPLLEEVEAAAPASPSAP